MKIMVLVQGPETAIQLHKNIAIFIIYIFYLKEKKKGVACTEGFRKWNILQFVATIFMTFF